MAKLPQFHAPTASAGADFEWFVYGSSLDFDAFRAWCDQHGYVMPDPARARPATLPGWRLAFNVNSNFWGGTVASLVEQPGAHVEGLLIPLPADALGFVRHKEGVLSGLFEERKGACVLGDGTSVPCAFYVANPERTVAESAPALRFLETLKKGARERGLSAAWLEQLARF